MSDIFPIIRVTGEVRDEQLGTKRKFWCIDPQDRFWLFKFNRPNNGEDWAEKLGAEFATLLGIPHAEVDLAQYNGQRGSISLDLTDDTARGDLVLGNSLLAAQDPSYPANEEYYFRIPQHTVDKVVAALTQDFIHLPGELSPVPEVSDALGLFTGYLLLDAFIANQDRHHENWGIIDRVFMAIQDAELCPTFDHASSFAHNLSDKTRKERLTTRDSGYTVTAFAAKARSSLYRSPHDAHPLTTDQAFLEVAKLRPTAAKFWIERLRLMPEAQIDDLLVRVPTERMSLVTKDFTRELLRCNRSRLVGVEL